MFLSSYSFWGHLFDSPFSLDRLQLDLLASKPQESSCLLLHAGIPDVAVSSSFLFCVLETGIWV